MSTTADLAAAIAESVPNVKRGSLVVFGDIFAGRIDNIHVVTGARSGGDPERLIVEFDGGETLEVWDPEFATVGLRRPRNRFFIEHTRADGGGAGNDQRDLG